MFWTVPLSIIRSFPLYTQQRYMLYRFADSLRAGSGWNSWWWMEELSKTCRVSFQNKKCWEISASSWFYYKKFITMHGLMNVTYFEHTWKYFSPPKSGVICWIRWRKRNLYCNLELLRLVIEICPLYLWSDLVFLFHDTHLPSVFEEIYLLWGSGNFSVISIGNNQPVHLISELWTRWTPLYRVLLDRGLSIFCYWESQCMLECATTWHYDIIKLNLDVITWDISSSVVTVAKWI